MARRGAARRMKREVKREHAKETRGGQKYKNQKGGIAKNQKHHRKGGRFQGGRRGQGEDEEDEEEEGEVRHRPRHLANIEGAFRTLRTQCVLSCVSARRWS